MTTKKQMRRDLNTKYPFIRAWGWRLGSCEEFIVATQQAAERDDAPRDAIYYRRINGDALEWVRVTECCGTVRFELEQVAGDILTAGGSND